MNERIVQAAMQYAAKGWRIVVLGDGGTQRGKVPRLGDWKSKATSDEEQLAEQLEKWPKSNIGLLLGPETGLIDVEFDSDEGRATAERLFKETITPTYASSRSVHRLFRWDGRLPPRQKIMLNGLEIRLGGGGKSTQSVLPPSLHPTGEPYYWLSGLSPEEVEPAELPRELFLRLTNVEYALEAAGVSSAASGGGSGKTHEDWNKVVSGVQEGGRNEAMAALVGKWLAELTDDEIDSKDSVQKVYLAAHGVNRNNRPPMPDDEVEAVFRSILGRERRKRASTAFLGASRGTIEREMEQVAADPLEAAEMTSGFGLTIVESDPTEFLLSSEIFGEIGGVISLTAAQIQSFQSLRSIVLDRARVLLPKGLSKKWDGILASLILTATRVDANPELHRPAIIAAVILESHDPTIRTSIGEIREYGVGGVYGVVTVDDKTVAVSVRQLKNHLKIDGILDQPKQSEIVRLLEMCEAECRIGKTRAWFVSVQALRRIARMPETT